MAGESYPDPVRVVTVGTRLRMPAPEMFGLVLSGVVLWFLVPAVAEMELRAEDRPQHPCTSAGSAGLDAMLEKPGDNKWLSQSVEFCGSAWDFS